MRADASIYLAIISLFVAFGLGTSDVLCLINSSRPAYQPNIYLCNDTFSCCLVFGQQACCANDISLKEFAKQCVIPVSVGVFCLLMAALTNCYFDDADPVEFKEKEKNDIDWTHALVAPSQDHTVKDPVFGM